MQIVSRICFCHYSIHGVLMGYLLGRIINKISIENAYYANT